MQVTRLRAHWHNLSSIRQKKIHQERKGKKAEGGFVDGSVDGTRTARISNERASKPKKGGRAADNHEALVVTVIIPVYLLILSQRVKDSIWSTVLALICHKGCIARRCR